jgi:hypothetical protein
MLMRFLFDPTLLGAFLFKQEIRLLIVDFLVREFIAVLVLTALVILIPFWRVIARIH